MTTHQAEPRPPGDGESGGKSAALGAAQDEDHPQQVPLLPRQAFVGREADEVLQQLEHWKAHDGVGEEEAGAQGRLHRLRGKSACQQCQQPVHQ